jgi:RHS repeat-associated protein
VKKVTGGVTTVFVYNVAGQLIAEYDSLTTSPPGSGGTSYLTTDHLGSTRVVTGQDQSVKARHDYLPFGEEVASNIGGRLTAKGYTANDPTQQRFTQKERDAESGLDYFLARYYSGAQGRFTSPDEPLSGQDENDPQTWNLYTYTSNNPLPRYDPDGRRWFYTEENGVVVDVQWVNPNSDGTYTSPGEGWIEFVPTKDKPALVVPLYDEDGTHLGAYHFHEKADGSPFTHIAWSGATKTVGPQLVLDFLILKGVGKIGGAAIGAFGRLGARALEAWQAYRAAAAVEGATGLVSKASARDALERLPASQAAKEAAKRAISRATTSSTIDVVKEGSSVVVRISRPGRSGHQVIESVIDSAGKKTVVQKAYDAAGKLVHHHPKN